MAYTKLELHLSSGPRQPLNMAFACATSQGVVALLKSPYFGHRNGAPCSTIYCTQSTSEISLSCTYACARSAPHPVAQCIGVQFLGKLT